MGGPYANDPVEDMRRRPVSESETLSRSINEFADKSDRITLSDRMSQLEQTIHETHKLIERMDEQIQFALKPSYPRDDVNKAVSGGLPDVSPLCKDIDTMADLARKNNRYLDELIRRIDV